MLETIALILGLGLPTHAGKLRYPNTRPVVIDSTGKTCVSFGKNEIGEFVAACPTNSDGTCPSTETCAKEPSVTPTEGRIKPGEYSPGLRNTGDSPEAASGASLGNRAH